LTKLNLIEMKRPEPGDVPFAEMVSVTSVMYVAKIFYIPFTTNGILSTFVTLM